MADAGMKAQFISGDGIVSAEFASIAGPAAEGVLNTFGPDPRNNPKSADIVKKFRDAGFEPEAYTLYSYAAVQVVAVDGRATYGFDSEEQRKGERAGWMAAGSQAFCDEFVTATETQRNWRAERLRAAAA